MNRCCGAIIAVAIAASCLTAVPRHVRAAEGKAAAPKSAAGAPAKSQPNAKANTPSQPVKPSGKPAAKPAKKPAAKPTGKPVGKPAATSAKKAAKPAKKPPAKPAQPPLGNLVFTTVPVNGRGAPGPYVLPNTKIADGTISVMLDGRYLQSGADYAIDPALGILRFTNPLPSGKTALVRYAHDRAARARKPGVVELPAKLRSTQTSHVNVLYQYDDKTKRETAGFQVDRSLSTGLKLTGLVLFNESPLTDPFAGKPRPGAASKGKRASGKSKQVSRKGKAKAAAPAPERGAMARAAIQTSAQLDAGKTSTVATFTKVGKEFKGSGKYRRLRAGTKQVAVNSKMNVNQAMSLRAGWTTADAGKPGSDSKSLSGGLTLKPSKTMTLDLGYSDRDAGGEHDRTTRQIKLSTQPVGDLKLSANMVNTRLHRAGREQDVLQLRANAGQHLSVTGNLSQLSDDEGVSLIERRVNLELKPDKKVTLSGGIANRRKSGEQVDVQRVALTSRPLPWLDLSGEYERRDSNAEDDDLPDAVSLRLRLRPSKTWSLTAQHRANHDLKPWQPANYSEQSLQLTSRPRSWLSLTAGIRDIEYDHTLRGREIADFKVSLKLGQRHSVYTRFSLTDNQNKVGDDAVERSYALGYAYKAGSALGLSLEGRFNDPDYADTTASKRDKYVLEGALKAQF